MSLWQEKEDNVGQGNPPSMTDVIFKIECQSLPVDHAAALSNALCEQQPWLKEVTHTGIHPIHVAGSQNGWQRPETNEHPLLLSKRTRLKVRISSAHSDKLIQGLKNTVHAVDNHRLKILDGRVSSLLPTNTLFSRYTVYLNDNANPADESAFEQQVFTDCQRAGFSPTKILCGRSHSIAIHGEKITARSVMLADVPTEHSLKLQEHGLGDYRLIGCGILIPHKDTDAVN